MTQTLLAQLTNGLAGRRALITGGGTGFGRHFAHVLAAAGAAVVVTARRVDKIEAVAAEIRAAGGQALAIPMDVTDNKSVQNAFTTAEAAFGPVDILVNNAGVGSDKSLLDLPEEQWDAVIDTNLKGAWLVAREAAARLIQAKTPGSIINIASVVGLRAQRGLGPYAASKAGLIHLTRALAIEWARYDIRVNAIAPGYYHTDITEDFLQTDTGQALIKRIPQRRLGALDHLSGPLLLLASDASAYMTGSVIPVDGGLAVSSL